MNASFSIGRWTLMTFLGWLAGVILILLFSNFVEIFGIDHIQFVIGIGMAAGVNYFQWRYLWKLYKQSISWCVTGIVGMSIPFVLVDFFIDPYDQNKLWIATISGSFVTALFQFFILRKHFQHAVLWIPFTVVGWFGSLGLLFLVDISMELKVSGTKLWLLFLFNLLFILGGGAIVGFTQGIAWKWIQKTAYGKKQSTC